MSRLGTCVFAHQIHEVERGPASNQPHLKAQIELWPEIYTCQFFDNSELPPPIARHNGRFFICEGDCEACPYYMPAGDKLLVRALRKKRLKKRASKAKVSL